jgi:ribA/ribD-fused uncharacterized protein
MTDQITSFRGDNLFLSNFYVHPITMGGVKYPTLEHAFQAAKSHDPVERDLIRRAQTPGIAKQRGRAVKLRADWEKFKYEIMEKLVREKFKDKVLSGLLLATREANIIEGNTWGDTTWGAVEQAKTGRWVGKNALGKILMKIRAELQAPNINRNIIV